MANHCALDIADYIVHDSFSTGVNFWKFLLHHINISSMFRVNFSAAEDCGMAHGKGEKEVANFSFCLPIFLQWIFLGGPSLSTSGPKYEFPHTFVAIL